MVVRDTKGTSQPDQFIPKHNFWLYLFHSAYSAIQGISSSRCKGLYSIFSSPLASIQQTLWADSYNENSRKYSLNTIFAYMPSPPSQRSQAALSAAGLALMLGCKVLQPAAIAAIPEEWKRHISAKLGEGALSILGGIGVSLGSEKLQQWARARSSALAGHPVIGELIELAMQKCMEDFATQNEKQRGAVAQIQKAIPGSISEPLKELVVGQTFQANSLLCSLPQDPATQAQWQGTWDQLLEPAMAQAGKAARVSLKSHLAAWLSEHIVVKIQLLVQQDRLAETPLKGRAFSAFEAHVQAQRVLDLEEIKYSLSELASAQQSLDPDTLVTSLNQELELHRTSVSAQ
ncbi:MAG: hypothetical protein V3W41_09155, partial [Planctomycetota bacterium]